MKSHNFFREICMKSHIFAFFFSDSNIKSVSICVICVPYSYLTQTSHAQIFIPKPTLFREFRAFLCALHIINE